MLRPLLVLSALVASPFAALAMDNADIIKMHKGGLSEETIIAAVLKEKADYDTSPTALIDLKAAGVSEKIIQKMIAQQAGPAAPAGGGATDKTGVFWQEFPSIAPAKIAPVVGQEYFTRFTFREEKNEHNTTNYTRGNAVPINTRVKLVSLSGSKMTLKRLDNGQDVKVENADKYTKKTMAEIAALMLSSEKTPLERLPAEVASAIVAGEMRKGMTKELLLMARGFPPAHETPSIDGDRWVYWSSRFVKQTVIFVDGRLSEGRGLY